MGCNRLFHQPIKKPCRGRVVFSTVLRAEAPCSVQLRSRPKSSPRSGSGPDRATLSRLVFPVLPEFFTEVLNSCFPGFPSSLASGLPDTFLRLPSTGLPLQRYFKTPCYVLQILRDPSKSASDSRFATSREVIESFARILLPLSRECLCDPDLTQVLR